MTSRDKKTIIEKNTERQIMQNFICPVCRKPLILEEKSYRCAANHCFDISKYGYVNLLLAGSSSNHGDDKLMVKARKSFLNAGYYRPLLDVITENILNITKNDDIIIDSGCGEGWYSFEIKNALNEKNISVQMYAIDISKNALVYAGKRSGDICFAVASAYNLPFSDACCDILISLFAPFAKDEFLRVLKPGGYFITAFPLENHLFGLKSAIYDTPYKNEVEDICIAGFDAEFISEIKYSIVINNKDDIQSLFKMTPYYYKTSITDQQKLSSLDILKTEVEFQCVVYRKK